jgi:opacity protein-like surface antigen
MKPVLIAAFVLLPCAAWAQTTANLPATYGEVALGASFLSSVNTDTYSFTYGANSATGKIKLGYDTAVTAGVEMGVAGVGMPEIRLGVGYEYLPARFSSATVVGTINGVASSATVSRAQVEGAGLTLDNDVHLVTGNAYYSLPLVGPVRPYVGLGVGAAIIQNADTQLALTGTLGVRAALSDQAYVGLRYRFYRIEGPTDSLGISYSAITNQSVMALLGFYMD